MSILPDRDGGRPARGLRRIGWLLAGSLCVVLGMVGAIVPLLPTTIFMILGGGCFARSSARLEAWLLHHPRFGASLRTWRAEGAIPRAGKRAACIGISVGYGLFLLAVRPAWSVAVIVAAVMLGCAIWIVGRPSPANDL